MAKLNQQGALDVWIIVFIVTLLLFLGSAGFGVWAFGSRQNYKNHTDKIVNDAVAVARQQEDAKEKIQLAEDEKQPLRQYQGPATYGSIVVMYPKSWSGYVDETGSSGNVIDGYFFPNIVPGLQSQKDFALRISVVNQSYSSVMQQYGSYATAGKATVSAYRLPLVQAVLGSRVVGALNPGQQDDMIVLPLRDKTLEVSTQSTEFSNDFNTYILKNLSFSP